MEHPKRSADDVAILRSRISHPLSIYSYILSILYLSLFPLVAPLLVHSNFRNAAKDRPSRYGLFLCGIEVRDHPELAGKPVAVGGARDRRGVLTTCNYEAREFGVRSAMPTFQALQKCPHLIVMPTRFDVYRRESTRIREILLKFSPIIEPLSLDEAFLDLSEHPGETSATVTVMRQLI